MGKREGEPLEKRKESLWEKWEEIFGESGKKTFRQGNDFPA